MYIVTGNDEVFALNAKTGEILWERWSGIDQQISTVCCGWDNRGLAMGEGLLFLGQLDANVVARRRRPSPTRSATRSCRIAPYRMGGGGGSAVTAGRLVFRGDPDGNFLAIDAKTGEELWRFQTGFGADAPAIIYEVDGDEYVAIATGGNSLGGSAYGDAVWVFSLKGPLGPLWPPPPPPKVAGPGGPIAQGIDMIKIGDRNVEYSYFPARTRIKTATSVTFTNVGDIPHTATDIKQAKWDIGVLEKGQSKTITFSEPGIHYYICAPHPWMYGEIFVEK